MLFYSKTAQPCWSE